METNIKVLVQKALDVLLPIPEDQFVTGTYTDKQEHCCSAGYINKSWNGYPSSIEMESALLAREMIKMFPNSLYNHQELNQPIGGIVWANDYQSELFPQDTPKQRVVALLTQALEKL